MPQEPSQRFRRLRELKRSDVLTSATALELQSPPESMVILGGGYVGLEFAQMYHRFGSRVILLEMKPRILAEHEESISERLTQYLKEEGIEIITGATVTRVQGRGKMKIITAEMDGKERTFEGEALLVGVGITPNSGEIGLERAGVEVTQKGYIQVNDEMRTTNENYLCGRGCGLKNRIRNGGGLARKHCCGECAHRKPSHV
ncbi:MAG: FAD-dependent oxidoreductase (plasmid) [Candidatus Manganitrophus sp.]|nr:MAG: FAD-dependent oxidoreductase [Candidatus Manganitrophus sp.]